MPKGGMEMLELDGMFFVGAEIRFLVFFRSGS